MKRLLFVVLAALCVAPIKADDGRDFAGRYDLKTVTTGSDGRVSLTFFVEVQNVSGAPLSGVTLELQDAIPSGPVALGPFDFEDAATIRLSLEFVINSATYDEWSSGGARMTGRWTDAQGNIQKRVVELSRIVMPEEVQ